MPGVLQVETMAQVGSIPLLSQPDFKNKIAYLAGFNAMNILAAATLKEHEGTQKGAVLNAALGKESLAFLHSNAGGLTDEKGGIAKKDNVHYVKCRKRPRITHKCRAQKTKTRTKMAGFFMGV